jgi:type IV secretory pathway TrbF-like protein
MGFSSLGKASFDHNRLLRNKRTAIKDHPYFGKGERQGDPNPYGEELRVWQEQKARNASRLRKLIFALLAGLMLGVVLLRLLW